MKQSIKVSLLVMLSSASIAFAANYCVIYINKGDSAVDNQSVAALQGGIDALAQTGDTYHIERVDSVDAAVQYAEDNVNSYEATLVAAHGNDDGGDGYSNTIQTASDSHADPSALFQDDSVTNANFCGRNGFDVSDTQMAQWVHDDTEGSGSVYDNMPSEF